MVAVGVLGATFAQQSTAIGTPVITDLSAPRGITALAGGDVLVAEPGAGRIVRVAPDGTLSEVFTGLPSTQSIASGTLKQLGVSAAIADGFGGFRYVVNDSTKADFGSVYSATFDGTTTLLADLAAYEVTNNTDGGTDAQGAPELLSDPWDIAFDGEGGVYVSDSAANAIILIGVAGNVKPYAVFPDIANPLFPFNGEAMIPQHPRGMAIGPDGAVYVATFTGFPHPTGEARVYRFKDKNADDDALDDGEITIVASGLTAATDVAFDTDGSLLVSQYSTDMQSNALGRISRIVDGEAQTIVHLLTTPTGLAVTEAGRILVSEESLGVITDVTDAPVGGFSAPITPGVTLAVYGGGSADQLSIEAADAGATTVAITSSGSFIVLVPGAPSFVNSSFNAKFPFTVPAGTLLLILSQ